MRLKSLPPHGGPPHLWLRCSSSLDEAAWDFGGVGCPGFRQTVTCTPLFTACLTQPFKYQDGGEFTVTLRVDGGGPFGKTITVNDFGSCESGPCTFTISPSANTIGSLGGTGTVDVTTQDPILVPALPVW